MVKFGKYIESHQIPEWSTQYVRYKRLKKLIKQIELEHGTGSELDLHKKGKEAGVEDGDGDGGKEKESGDDDQQEEEEKDLENGGRNSVSTSSLNDGGSSTASNLQDTKLSKAQKILLQQIRAKRKQKAAQALRLAQQAEAEALAAAEANAEIAYASPPAASLLASNNKQNKRLNARGETTIEMVDHQLKTGQQWIAASRAAVASTEKHLQDSDKIHQSPPPLAAPGTNGSPNGAIPATSTTTSATAVASSSPPASNPAASASTTAATTALPSPPGTSPPPPAPGLSPPTSSPLAHTRVSSLPPNVNFNFTNAELQQEEPEQDDQSALDTALSEGKKHKTDMMTCEEDSEMRYITNYIPQSIRSTFTKSEHAFFQILEEDVLTVNHFFLKQEDFFLDKINIIVEQLDRLIKEEEMHQKQIQLQKQLQQAADGADNNGNGNGKGGTNGLKNNKNKQRRFNPNPTASVFDTVEHGIGTVKDRLKSIITSAQKREDANLTRQQRLFPDAASNDQNQIRHMERMNRRAEETFAEEMNGGSGDGDGDGGNTTDGEERVGSMIVETATGKVKERPLPPQPQKAPQTQAQAVRSIQNVLNGSAASMRNLGGGATSGSQLTLRRNAALSPPYIPPPAPPSPPNVPAPIPAASSSIPLPPIDFPPTILPPPSSAHLQQNIQAPLGSRSSLLFKQNSSSATAVDQTGTGGVGDGDGDGGGSGSGSEDELNITNDTAAASSATTHPSKNNAPTTPAAVAAATSTILTDDECAPPTEDEGPLTEDECGPPTEDERDVDAPEMRRNDGGGEEEEEEQNPFDDQNHNINTLDMQLLQQQQQQQPLLPPNTNLSPATTEQQQQQALTQNMHLHFKFRLLTAQKPWRVLKKALIELYRGLHLLRNYKILNFTGFVKILKKYDKLGLRENEWKAGLTLLPRIQTTHFLASPILKAFIRRVELIFAQTFTDGSIKEAIQSLRVVNQPLQSNVTFYLGLLLGISGVFLFILLFMIGWINSGYSPPVTFLISLPVWRGLALVILHMSGWGINVMLFQRYRINHEFIFGINPRTELKWEQMLLASATLITAWFILLDLYLFIQILQASNIWTNAHAGWIPFTIFILFFLLCFMPYDTFFRPTRWYTLRTLSMIVTAPFHPVEFKDFYTADQLCSLINVFNDIMFSGCYLFSGHFVTLGRTVNSDKQCSDVQNTAVWCLSILPYVWRLLQCFRKYYDHPPSNRRQLWNAGKYTSSIITTLLSLLTKFYPSLGIKPVWIASATISTIYSYSWDVYCDWGFLRFEEGEYVPKLLRRKLVLNNHLPYYFAIVSNAALRVAWVFTISPDNIGLRSDVFNTLVWSLEVVRRNQWNFYRLENEHLTNCENYRVVNIVPLKMEEMQPLMNTAGGGNDSGHPGSSPEPIGMPVGMLQQPQQQQQQKSDDATTDADVDADPESSSPPPFGPNEAAGVVMRQFSDENNSGGSGGGIEMTNMQQPASTKPSLAYAASTRHLTSAAEDAAYSTALLTAPDARDMNPDRHDEPKMHDLTFVPDMETHSGSESGGGRGMNRKTPSNENLHGGISPANMRKATSANILNLPDGGGGLPASGAAGGGTTGSTRSNRSPSVSQSRSRISRRGPRSARELVAAAQSTNALVNTSFPPSAATTPTYSTDPNMMIYTNPSLQHYANLMRQDTLVPRRGEQKPPSLMRKGTGMNITAPGGAGGNNSSAGNSPSPAFAFAGRSRSPSRSVSRSRSSRNTGTMGLVPSDVRINLLPSQAQRSRPTSPIPSLQQPPQPLRQLSTNDLSLYGSGVPSPSSRIIGGGASVDDPYGLNATAPSRIHHAPSTIAEEDVSNIGSLPHDSIMHRSRRLSLSSHHNDPITSTDGDLLSSSAYDYPSHPSPSHAAATAASGTGSLTSPGTLSRGTSPGVSASSGEEESKQQQQQRAGSRSPQRTAEEEADDAFDRVLARRKTQMNLLAAAATPMSFGSAAQQMMAMQHRQQMQHHQQQQQQQQLLHDSQQQQQHAPGFTRKASMPVLSSASGAATPSFFSPASQTRSPRTLQQLRMGSQQTMHHQAHPHPHAHPQPHAHAYAASTRNLWHSTLPVSASSHQTVSSTRSLQDMMHPGNSSQQHPHESQQAHLTDHPDSPTPQLSVPPPDLHITLHDDDDVEDSGV